MNLKRSGFLLCAVFFLSISNLRAQSGVRPVTTPTPEQTEKVSTEEIKLNVLAINGNGDVASELKPEDLVIMEDNRLQQASSVRRIPANVLFLLDVGGEITYAKRNKVTAQTARSLVDSLAENDLIAAMQYDDKTSVLSDWTKDRAQIADALGDTKLGFGKRSAFYEAMSRAVEYFAESPTENRHLVVITDGVDTFDDAAQKSSMMRKILSSDVNVHVISYTQLQKLAMGDSTKTVKGGGTRPKPLPPGANMPHSETIQNFPVVTINTDREMIRKRRADAEKLKSSEKFLTTLAEDTNGEIFLPDSTDEMIEKTSILAKTIDSQYVVTYIPKRPLDESRDGEIRVIEASSHRPGTEIQGKRKFIVTNKN